MRVCTRNRLILSRWMIYFLVNHITSSAFERRNLELFTLKLIFRLPLYSWRERTVEAKIRLVLMPILPRWWFLDGDGLSQRWNEDFREKFLLILRLFWWILRTLWIVRLRAQLWPQDWSNSGFSPKGGSTQAKRETPSQAREEVFDGKARASEGFETSQVPKERRAFDLGKILSKSAALISLKFTQVWKFFIFQSYIKVKTQLGAISRAPSYPHQNSD